MNLIKTNLQYIFMRNGSVLFSNFLCDFGLKKKFYLSFFSWFEAFICKVLYNVCHILDESMKSEHDTVAYRSGYDTGPTNPLPQVEIQLINDFFCKSSLFKLCSVLFCHLFGKLYVKFSSAYSLKIIQFFLSSFQYFLLV